MSSRRGHGLHRVTSRRIVVDVDVSGIVSVDAELLDALARAQLAARRLGLSYHTVHEYVNALYAHFDVTTRAELLARFIPPDALR